MFCGTKKLLRNKEEKYKYKISMHRQDKFYIFIYSSYMMMCPIPFFYYFLPVCMFVLFFVQTISRNSCSSSGSNNNNSTKASPMCRITGGNHSLKIIHITTLAGVYIIHYIYKHMYTFSYSTYIENLLA